MPVNPLTPQGYPSIGCMPCTTPVADGEDPRVGSLGAAATRPSAACTSHSRRRTEVRHECSGQLAADPRDGSALSGARCGGRPSESDRPPGEGAPRSPSRSPSASRSHLEVTGGRWVRFGTVLATTTTGGFRWWMCRGRVTSGSAPVRERFLANFDEGQEQGASVCVTVDGEPVVDLWAGERRRRRATRGSADTIVNVYSTTKTMAATVHADARRPRRDRPRRAGGDVLARVRGQRQGGRARRATCSATPPGCPGFDPPITTEELYDRDALRGQPRRARRRGGSRARSRATTPSRQGYLEGEIVRRVTGAHASARSSARRWPSRSAPTSTSGSRRPRTHRVADLVAAGDGIAAERIARSRLDPGPRRSVSCPLDAARHPHPRVARRRDPGRRRHRQRPLGRPRALGARLRRRGRRRARSCRQAGVERDPRASRRTTSTSCSAPKMRMGTASASMSDVIPLSPNPRSFFWGGWGGSIAHHRHGRADDRLLRDEQDGRPASSATSAAPCSSSPPTSRSPADQGNARR